jgi:hypothetical protein
LAIQELHFVTPSPFTAGMMYSTITSGAKSAAGISLNFRFHMELTTGINSQGLSAVDLGAAGNYVKNRHQQ